VTFGVSFNKNTRNAHHMNNVTNGVDDS